MNILLQELEAVVSELEPLVLGGRVQEWRQPSATGLVCSLRVPGETVHLLLEVASGAARMHRIGGRTGTLNPPPAFVSKLRKELSSCRLEGISMPWNDRVAVLRFRSAEQQLALVAEFSGHHPNLFLTTDKLEIVSVFRPSASHIRNLLVGRPYSPPPAPGSKEKGTIRLSAGESASRQLEQLYDLEERLSDAEYRRNRLWSALVRKIRKTSRTIRKVEGELERAIGAQSFRHQGELLKVNLHLVSRGMESVSVPDWSEEGASTVIRLDAGLTPRENLERLFARYKKGMRGLPRIRTRLSQLAQLHATLASLEDRLRTGAKEDLADIEALARGAGVTVGPARARGERRSRQNREHAPERRFVTASGKCILVGKGGKDNHAVTFQMASPHDIWLHARGFAGSHVVIPLTRGQEPDSETLLDAAHLAIHFSKAPSSGFCEVIWTRRKNVRAIPKGPPGKVTVTHENNVAFNFSPARLADLLERRDDCAPLR